MVGHQRHPSRKLEPLVEQAQKNGGKFIPKPSISPEMLGAEGQSMLMMHQANTKVNPFGGNGALVASHSIQNTNQAANLKNQLDLGAPPVNARNINVQSVMAESSNITDMGRGSNHDKGEAVNLRKTFNNGAGPL